jgi:hypothetical protein
MLVVTVLNTIRDVFNANMNEIDLDRIRVTNIDRAIHFTALCCRGERLSGVSL